MRSPRLLLLLLLTASLGTAQVFWRRPRSTPGDWTRACHTPVRLQETRGDTELFAVTGSLPQIEHDLRARHGNDLLWMPGDVTAWALARSPGTLHRYLIQPQPHPGAYWVTALHQPLDSLPPPAARPRTHQLRDLPAYPNSQPDFFLQNDTNRLTLEISITPAPPELVLHHLDRALLDDGWAPSPANLGGMRLYLRGDTLALLSASQSPDGATRVIRLHKPLHKSDPIR